MLKPNAGINSFYIQDLIIDGNSGTYSNPLRQCTANVPNILIGYASSWHIIHIKSMSALSASGAAVGGSNFFVTQSIFDNNGLQDRTQGNTCISDGLTIDSCNGCSVTNNTITESTDVGLSNQGQGANQTETGNIVTQTNRPVLTGLSISDNSSTPGDFSNALFQYNVITANHSSKMDFGFRIGPHAWFPTRYIKNGAYKTNTITRAEVNLDVDGACSTSGNSLNIQYNYMNSYDTGSFIRYPSCPLAAHGNYARAHCRSISSSNNYCDGVICGSPVLYQYDCSQYPCTCTSVTTDCKTLTGNCPP